jgi:2-C-methyl-D-erythritol 2,4-cyclodiphosphate synthase
MRIGLGFDVHKLVVGRKLVLGGVIIPYEKGLIGHSDADVLVHAINDALLGAAALGDIGKHFPDYDPKYKDISSLVLLGEVRKLLEDTGYKVVNIDSVICAQKPKMANYIDKMCKNVADTLGVTVDKVSIKATTTEEMGFEGRGEGISAKAICMIEKV